MEEAFHAAESALEFVEDPEEDGREEDGTNNYQVSSVSWKIRIFHRLTWAIGFPTALHYSFLSIPRRIRAFQVVPRLGFLGAARSGDDL
jgi:hypothetical protein